MPSHAGAVSPQLIGSHEHSPLAVGHDVPEAQVRIRPMDYVPTGAIVRGQDIDRANSNKL